MRSSEGRVGVRELRQSLSVYLRRVAGGETFEVTERGRSVAILAPFPSGATAIERLVAAGRAIGPAGDLRELGRPRGRASRRVSRILTELRGERV